MFGKLIEKLKAAPKRIVFTEGTDPRILEASARLLSSNFLTPILVGREEDVHAAAEAAGFSDSELFERSFQRRTGMEARVYRKMLLGK